MELRFYSRPNCSLCANGNLQLELALEEFDQHIHVEYIDIEQNDAIHERFMFRIPVIMHENKVVQEGILDFATIYEYIEQNI